MVVVEVKAFRINEVMARFDSAKMGERLGPLFRSFFKEGGERIVRNIQVRMADTSASGATAQSVKIASLTGFGKDLNCIMEVGSYSKKAVTPNHIGANPEGKLEALEFGRKPGKAPPIDAIFQWLRDYGGDLKLGIPKPTRGDAYRIARVIGNTQRPARFAYYKQHGYPNVLHEEDLQAIDYFIGQMGDRIVEWMSGEGGV